MVPLDSINQEDYDGVTPLDWCYDYNTSPICQEIIALLRSNGGIANYYDENGNYIGNDIISEDEEEEEEEEKEEKEEEEDQTEEEEEEDQTE